MWNPPADHPLRRLFAGVTEYTFQTRLGVADPNLIDYLSVLLARFVHDDTIHRLKSGTGARMTQVVDMVAEAEALPPEGRTRREVHRHIGDFALFWTGVYPEALAKLRSKACKDYFVDYCAQGKRSYFIASTFDDDESPVLRRLSDEFEMCAGLTEVRREWERAAADAAAAGWKIVSYRTDE
ncbi:MAG: hypothetical protein U0746_09025 [Gemmataceae bacterium]